LSLVERVQLKTSLFEGVVRKWIEFWRWQSKVIENKWQGRNKAVKRRLHM
jgi:hypothetical protein